MALSEAYTGLPLDADDQRALAYWFHVALIANQQALMQSMLYAEGTPGLQVYDDWDAIMRTDNRVNGGSEPVDHTTKRWNNSAAL